MAHPRKTVLQALQTRALAILSGSDKAVLRCWIVDDVASGVRRARQIPRFPTALLAAGPTTKHRHNNKLETLSITLAVVTLAMRDHQHEHATETATDLLDLLLEGDGTSQGLKYDLGTGTPVVARADGEGAVTIEVGGAALSVATATLEVKIQRA